MELDLLFGGRSRGEASCLGLHTREVTLVPEKQKFSVLVLIRQTLTRNTLCTGSAEKTRTLFDKPSPSPSPSP